MNTNKGNNSNLINLVKKNYYTNDDRKKKLINTLTNAVLNMNQDSPVALMAALIIILNKENEDLKKTYNNLLPFLLKYEQMFRDMKDNSIDLYKLKELSELAKGFITKNGNKKTGNGNVNKKKELHAIYPTIIN